MQQTRFDLLKPATIRAVQIVGLALFLVVSGCASTSSSVSESTTDEPKTPREFRAAWIATVANIDWPSKPGLHSAEQKAELRSLLDRAVSLNLNAVVLQVRPAADALYASDLEPWSEYLTGAMGTPPTPYYDPLTFAVDEAHKRGLELHAWFNPFRALHPVAVSPVSPDHVSMVHPDWVIEYGDYLWIDPGFADARRFSLDVLMDVVRRYDIDGVHMDDYFYPYQINDSTDQLVPFPDGPSYEIAKARNPQTPTAINDWRRSNVDSFVETLYDEVKATKPWVKVGISPFGIWRPGYPEQIKGYDAYDRLYADSRKWLREGWIDYFSPQLYWDIDKRAQSYPVLLDWWRAENLHNRHIWPGNYASRIIATNSTVWQPEEILRQIATTRMRSTNTGNIQFSMKALVAHPTGLGRELRAGPYLEPAVVPASPWIPGEPPQRPSLSWDDIADEDILLIKPASVEPVWLWVVKKRYNRKWTIETVPGWQQRVVTNADGERPDAVVVRAVNRVGLESQPAHLAKRID